MSDERLASIVVPVALVLACAIGLTVGVLLAVITLRSSEPWCPTEDSCEIDYEGGEWRIIEVTP